MSAARNKLRWGRTRQSGVSLTLMLMLLAGLASVAHAAEEPKVDEATVPAKADPFAVPDGTVDELVTFIDELLERRPTERTREAVFEFIRKSRQALVTAADKAVAAGAEGEKLERVLSAKVAALGMLAQIGEDTATAQMKNLVDELREKKLDGLAKMAETTLLAASVPAVAKATGAEQQKMYDELKAQILAADPDVEHFRVAHSLIRALEHGENRELAVGAYLDMATHFAKSHDPRVSAMAEQLTASARRLDLVGKPFVGFAGKTVKGDAFELASLKDKVVLIDFWATWCGPCVAELPNVKKNYEAYHERGFEVVGVSLDDDRGALERFLEDNQIPWVTLLGPDAQAAEGNTPLAEYYGVTAIPTVILIGKDGNVVDINARGEKLVELLAQLLGPVESGDAASAPGGQ